MASFELVAKTLIEPRIEVCKYKSSKTGLTVVLADVEGPVVNGFFSLATEAHDDDGLPHTLEHLVFMGSEDYPYKGVLDLLANRCLASGTNAWTDTDHTCYTMTTAGSDGFLELMPIYLDHILYPTLTDSAFLTEVHHITGDGEDGGVVYCEMQGRENTGESRANLHLLRAVYPNSGYSAETGGIMHNLRTSTTNKKVCDYHAGFYRPENITVIITGKVKKDKVFEALKPLEEKILSKGDRGPFTKPWQTPVDPMTASQDLKILYPCDEEDCGFVYVGYRGPNCIEDYLTLTGCSLLLRYLSETSVSPLQREFVEIDDPFSSKVSHCILESLESLIYFVFENVPLPKIDLVLDKLKATLGKFANGEEKIDMKRMKSVIEKEILESLSNLETSPHDTVAYLVIGDMLYGRDENDFQERLNVRKQLEYFLDVEEEFWINMLKTYLINGNYICVRAIPSIEEQQRMSKEELDRIEQQRQQLGPEGLSKKAEDLTDAMAKNEELPPECMLTKVCVPNPEGINFHYLKIFKSTENESIPCFDSSECPVYAELYDVHTNFVYMIVTLNTHDLDPRLRPYLLLFLELILESPVRRGDKLIPYEEVVTALEADTISSGTKLGLESNSIFSCGPFSHTACLMLQVDTKKYEIGVNWIVELLYASEFVAERIKVCASKMQNTVAQAKRKGNSVARDLLKAIYYEKDSNIQVSSMLRQQKFLGKILENLDSPEGIQRVIADLNTVRSSITKSSNIGVHIAVDLSKMACKGTNLSKPWKNIIPQGNEPSNTGLRVIPDWQIMKPDGIYPNFQGTIIGLGCVESSFLFHSAPSTNDFLDPDFPALLLYLQYLTQLEGPLWRLIRGQGFAYGYHIAPRPHEGLLCFTLIKATNLIAGFKETKTLIENQLQSGAIWDENLLASARSSLIFEIIEREKSVGSLVLQSLLASFKKVSAKYNQNLVKQINEVTEEKLNEVGKKYIGELFSPRAKTAIVCHPDKVKEIVNAFAGIGRNLIAVPTLEESILAK